MTKARGKFEKFLEKNLKLIIVIIIIIIANNKGSCKIYICP